jgi:hypothetical protein
MMPGARIKIWMGSIGSKIGGVGKKMFNFREIEVGFELSNNSNLDCVIKVFPTFFKMRYVFDAEVVVGRKGLKKNFGAKNLERKRGGFGREKEKHEVFCELVGARAPKITGHGLTIRVTDFRRANPKKAYEVFVVGNVVFGRKEVVNLGIDLKSHSRELSNVPFVDAGGKIEYESLGFIAFGVDRREGQVDEGCPIRKDVARRNIVKSVGVNGEVELVACNMVESVDEDLVRVLGVGNGG